MALKSHYINGAWYQGIGRVFEGFEPTLGVIWLGTEATKEEVTLAVDSARNAYPAWASLDLNSRINYLERYRSTLKKNKTLLTETISESTGKPLWEAATEVDSMINKIPISIDAYQQRTGITIRKETQGRGVVIHKPFGVIAVLGPFNFPGHLPNGHIVPALLAGNTVVFKPSELTPKVAEIMMNCWEEAELPAGVLNVVQGSARCGQYVVEAEIDGVFFTGSYHTGCNIHQHFAGHPKKIVALEMGGNNPLIVQQCHDVTAAIYTTIVSAFITAGQRCTAARRLIVTNTAWGDEFLNQLIIATKQLKIGYFRDIPEPFMGPVISATAAAFLLEQQEILIARGGNSLLRMQSIEQGTGLVTPAIIAMNECGEKHDAEIFGPLLQVYRSSNLTHAIQLANETQYGLAAGILSDKPEDYKEFASHIRAGVLAWNRPLTGSSSYAPFGGIGNSGNHRPSGFYAADYCAYPVASLEIEELTVPSSLLPGITL